MNRFLRVVFLCLSFAYAEALSASEITVATRYIRVALVQNASYLNLKVLGPYEIIDPRTKKVLSRGNNLKTTVTAYKGMTFVGALRVRSQKLHIKTKATEPVILDGKWFRGDLEFVRVDSNKLCVVNYIEIEDYVKGILYHEVSHYWPQEALKAQAVVSRSYALNQSKENAAKDFDVTSDIYSQVYGGMNAERYRTNEAVEATRGKVLLYKEKPFPAYFHATCAGHTEDASLLWNVDIVPLKGVECGFCKESPHFNWHQVFSLDELEDRLSAAGYKVGSIKTIGITGRDESGRVVSLKFFAEKQDVEIKAKDFRNIIGPNVIRSTNFSVNVVEKDAVFEGAGWGHGAGMCQWGAYFLAKQGKGFEEILKFYFPGADVKTF